MGILTQMAVRRGIWRGSSLEGTRTWLRPCGGGVLVAPERRRPVSSSTCRRKGSAEGTGEQTEVTQDQKRRGPGTDSRGQGRNRPSKSGRASRLGLTSAAFPPKSTQGGTSPRSLVMYLPTVQTAPGALEKFQTVLNKWYVSIRTGSGHQAESAGVRQQQVGQSHPGETGRLVAAL